MLGIAKTIGGGYNKRRYNKVGGPLMKVKSRIMIFLCITLCITTVGFAAFSTTLTITGTADIASTWKVVFTNIEQISKTSGVAIKSTPTASGTTATFNVGFTSPGDKIVYRVTIANQGTLNAVINEIKASESGSDAIIFELANINKGDILEAGDTTTFDVTIKYDENVISQPNITVNELTVTINYVQSVGQSITPSAPVIQVERLSAATLRHNTPRSDAGIDFSKTSEEDGTLGLYYTNNNTEDNKTTYYFRGAVDNNYVQFGSTDEGACTYNGHSVSYFDTSSNQMTNATKEQCTSTNVCAGNVVGLDEATCQVLSNSFLGGSATCTYNGHVVIGIADGGGTSNLPEEKCTSSKVCLLNNSMLANGMWLGLIGIPRSTCEGMAGIWTGEEGTYVGNNYNPYLSDKATYAAIPLTWRIVRINEDGSIRLILNNTIGESAFNENNDDNAYVGYMYGTPDSSTYEETHANEHDSTIKQFLDNWYTNNLSKYSSLISREAGFCGDRTIAPSAELWDTVWDTALGYGTNYTYYGAYNRLHNLYKPQFACPNASNDLYTLKGGNKGNKALDYPIGLITADEIAYAGGVHGKTNESYYLYGAASYWTMSPSSFWNLLVTFVDLYESNLGGSGDDNGGGVRPVINLTPNVQITGGNGTYMNPYVVRTN